MANHKFNFLLFKKLPQNQTFQVSHLQKTPTLDGMALQSLTFKLLTEETAQSNRNNNNLQAYYIHLPMIYLENDKCSHI